MDKSKDKPKDKEKDRHKQAGGGSHAKGAAGGHPPKGHGTVHHDAHGHNHHAGEHPHGHHHHDDKKEEEQKAKEAEEKKKAEEKEAAEKAKKEKEKASKAPPVLVDTLRGEEAKRAFSKRLIRAIQPVRILAIIFGQFPMTYREEKNGTFTFKFSWYLSNTLYFCIATGLTFFCLAMFVWNLFCHVVDLEAFRMESTPTGREERWYEKSLLHRHFMWVMSMFAALMQCCIVNFHMLKNRHYMPSVYTFYTRLVQEVHMDVSFGALQFSLILIGVYFSTTLAIILMGTLHFAPVTTGAPTVFGIYLFRLFALGEGLWITEDSGTRTAVQVCGALFLIFIFTASKLNMFMFAVHCKILRNAFACWNGRAYIAIMKGGKYFHTEEGRVTYRLLYKDHCVILDLLEAANRLYAGTMETYYALQMGVIFFEFYFLLRSARYGEDIHVGAEEGGQFFIRPFDWVPGGLLSFQSIFIAMGTAKLASSVGQEAMAGLDIVRRKTMLFRKTDDELIFQLSLQASFNSFAKFDFGAGGYEYINIDWIMGYINNIAGYFIILYQFQPVMDRSTLHEWVKRKNLGKFLEGLEELPDGHWQSTPPPPPPLYNI